MANVECGRNAFIEHVRGTHIEVGTLVPISISWPGSITPGWLLVVCKAGDRDPLLSKSPLLYPFFPGGLVGFSIIRSLRILS